MIDGWNVAMVLLPRIIYLLACDVVEFDVNEIGGSIITISSVVIVTFYKWSRFTKIGSTLQIIGFIWFIVVGLTKTNLIDAVHVDMMM